ncbi:hypothetical protein BABINDRAFT_162936 [Babjeviella inositovora NRRL Y-12698]|uniref:Large ribosomal subunit protein uL13m n=1 Tax=Babjeviella inositovora NRRL Y-12698 TaxID=984486 RepID=A0A1E3QLE6_9ASCO|nr:uncharacterized protein BABINDRAFT_162936 [Babjeviella inositovora NRRL Y-12698]ODQ78284.1 hypothetical protein BABINDRAFT_162936 [Babjeviella inositovora NRRL Y-12698]
MSQRLGKTGLAFSRIWHHVDVSADERTLGRLASSIAITLIGKHKPVFDKSHDCGDYVVVSNAAHLNVTGNKLKQKNYWAHSGKPGNLKLVPMERMVQNKGFGEVLRKAVSGMLPKNRLRDKRLARLRVFEGSDHPYKQNLIAFHDEQPLVREKLQKLEDKKNRVEVEA